uniref:NAD(P)H-quinone oxidoreductase subunit 3, chloroplastic n=1 Tax=Verdigellas peltata TaxID=542676 RepID=A0A161KB15_9VIRI|nr:NADH dehydrogenase subunit 3 [Verdigellas peltata]CZF96659.1 NADH dehydrogenase subunit 3 [Verdigellas peltata]
MNILYGYDYLLGFIILASIIPVLILLVSYLVRPKSQAAERQTTYESGIESFGSQTIQFTIRFYMFGLVFVFFDVETLFLYPWAINFSKLGIIGFIEAIIFVFILLLGLIYAWKKGALEWF